MSIKKLKLSELKIQSFVTSLENEGNQKGQGTDRDGCGTFQGASVTDCGGSGGSGSGDGPVDPSYATCNVVYCATNEQSCTHDGSFTCTPNEGC